MNFKNLIILMLLLLVSSIGAVSAQDNATCMDIEYNDNLVTMADDEVFASSPDNSSNLGSWDDLTDNLQNLKPGDVYNIDYDYKKPDNASVCGISINADNVTINGNGHIIEGNSKNILNDKNVNNLGNIFTVNGNNVQINNITIKDAGYDYSASSKEYGGILKSLKDTLKSFEDKLKKGNAYIKKCEVISLSPVCWLGDNGICSDCRFINNKAIWEDLFPGMEKTVLLIIRYF